MRPSRGGDYASYLEFVSPEPAGELQARIDEGERAERPWRKLMPRTPRADFRHVADSDFDPFALSADGGDAARAAKE